MRFPLKLLSLLGYLLVTTGILGTLFFRHYNGSLIPYPILWYLGFAAIGIAGFLLIYLGLKKSIRKEVEEYISPFELIKANGYRIIPDFDKCEFKSGSYTRETDDEENVWMSLIDPSFVDLKLDKRTSEHVLRSYIVYTDILDGEKHRFISQSFPTELTNLKFHTMNNKLLLWVDKRDHRKYFFEMLDY